MHISTYVCASTHTHAHTCAHTHTTYTASHVLFWPQHLCTHVHNACMYSYMHVCTMCAYAHAHTHKYFKEVMLWETFKVNRPCLYYDFFFFSFPFLSFFLERKEFISSFILQYIMNGSQDQISNMNLEVGTEEEVMKE